MPKPLIYLAGPLTHSDPIKEEQRAQDHSRYAGKLLQAGYLIYSPIAETWNIGKYAKIGGKWETWREKDLLLLSKCDRMLILQLEGWNESKGVKGEVKFCLTNNIPISVYDPIL